MNAPDLQNLFSLSVNPLELVLRGTAMYWLLFLLFRFVLRRDVGALGIADVLLLVLIADASQNAMSGGYESITDGCILVLTIAGWNYLLDWCSFHSPRIRKFVEPAPLLLVKNGRLLRKNMRRELITMEELWSQLRTQGVKDLGEVQAAFIEGDGEISVLRKGASGQTPPSPSRKLG
ncbi:DUF421 domain-containing protein [Polaromonas sp.]|uniref:DUF421 domain-containing protein n=1 Tax=Polaromonas sp. TaxID=1869339 RepID=UPI0035685D2E